MGRVTRERDWKWLRTASLDHEGFLPGMPWNACETAFERLKRHGLVMRKTIASLIPGDDRSFDRAIITNEGREALRHQGMRNLKRLQGKAVVPIDDAMTHFGDACALAIVMMRQPLQDIEGGR